MRRWLVLAALPLLGCANPLAGHQYTGADVELRYHRAAGFQHESRDTVGTWPPVEVESRSEQGRNALTLGVTMHFAYKAPKETTP